MHCVIVPEHVPGLFIALQSCLRSSKLALLPGSHTGDGSGGRAE